MTSSRLYAVDEIEAGVARLVDGDGRGFEVPLEWLPQGTRSGDVLEVSAFAGERHSLASARCDDDERRRRLERNREVLDRLRGADPGGDLAL